MTMCMVLAACAAPVADEESQSSDAPASEFFLPEFSLVIHSEVPLEIVHSGPSDFDITSEDGKTFFAHKAPYDEPSDGIGDWQIPRDMAEELQGPEPCVAFTRHAYILPLKEASQCEKVSTVDGSTAIIAVGPGFTFEGNDYAGSMIILPREDHAIVLYGIAGFPESERESQQIVERFTDAYPNDELWPPETDEQLQVYRDISDAVLRALKEPTAEVQAAMEELRELATGLSFALSV